MVSQEAARAIRELRADFRRYAQHDSLCALSHHGHSCSCGLDFAHVRHA
jgi:hypothetical protein